MNDLKVTQDNANKPRFATDMSKDQLKAAQAYDFNGPSSEHEQRLDDLGREPFDDGHDNGAGRIAETVDTTEEKAALFFERGSIL